MTAVNSTSSTGSSGSCASNFQNNIDQIGNDLGVQPGNGRIKAALVQDGLYQPGQGGLLSQLNNQVSSDGGTAQQETFSQGNPLGAVSNDLSFLSQNGGLGGSQMSTIG